MTKAPLLNVGNGGLTPHFPPVIEVSQSPEPFASCHCESIFPLSLRAKRGNPGGASDCFGTDVPRNDKREASLQAPCIQSFSACLPPVIASETKQSQQLPPLLNLTGRCAN